MTTRILFFTLLFLLSSSYLYAKQDNPAAFLLKANDDTSFMHYEFHTLAYEAAFKKDYDNAYRLYLKLAEKGDNRAEYNIGMMYMKGLGVDRAKMDAYKWLRRASKHGNKEAALYFKQMNERYEQKHQENMPKSKAKKEKIKDKTAVPQEPKTLEKNTTVILKKAEGSQSLSHVKKSKPKESSEEKSSLTLYLLTSGLFVIFFLLFFFFKRSKGLEQKEDKTAQNTPVYRSQMYDITYAHILDYHSELLKQVNLSQLKADEKKTQIYHMFLYGVIDYFCQLENFTDTEQRRIFSTHMGQQEGQEKLTAIMQNILEGQRDPSMYHYQATGGISAKAWHEDKSKGAPSMLKKVLLEKKV